MKDNKIFLSGYAKLPMEITAWELYRVVSVGLIVDRITGEILEADCTLATSVGRDFIIKILVGENLNDISNIEQKLIHNYFGSAKKALLTAIRICSKKYIDIINSIDIVEE